MIEVGPGGTLPSNARRVGKVGALVFMPTKEEAKINDLEQRNRDTENRLRRLEHALLGNA